MNAASDLEAVIAAAAVQTQLPAVLDADPVAAHGLPARLTDIGVKEPGPLRQGDPGLLYVKERLRRLGMVKAEGLLPAPRLCRPLQNQPDRPARGPVINGKGLLARHVKEQIPLSHAASQDHLDGVHAAGVILRDADRLLVL